MAPFLIGHEAITLSRTWKVIDQYASDALVPDRAALGIQGAATTHAMRPAEVQRFLRLRVVENLDGESPDRQPFSASLRRPWRQKASIRAGSDVQPGSPFYVAIIADGRGTIFKVGSLRLLSVIRAGRNR